MVISSTVIYGLYALGALEVIALILGLILIKVKAGKHYGFTPILVGFACYIIGPLFLSSAIQYGIGFIPGSQELFASNVWLYLIITSLLHALTSAPLMLLAYKYVLKKASIYTAMATGVSYWAYTIYTNVSTYLEQAQISQMANDGQLHLLVNETTTETVVNEYVEILKSLSVGDIVGQLLSVLALMAVTTLAFLLTFHAFKRKNFKFVALSVAIHFAGLFVSYATNGALWLYISVNALLLMGAIAGLIVYYRWYQEQKMLLIRQQREFKARRQEEYRQKLKEQEAITE